MGVKHHVGAPWPIWDMRIRCTTSAAPSGDGLRPRRLAGHCRTTFISSGIAVPRCLPQRTLSPRLPKPSRWARTPLRPMSASPRTTGLFCGMMPTRIMPLRWLASSVVRDSSICPRCRRWSRRGDAQSANSRSQRCRPIAVTYVASPGMEKAPTGGRRRKCRRRCSRNSLHGSVTSTVCGHVFLDLKLTPAQADAAIALLQRLHRLCMDKGLRRDVLFHILSPHLEIVAALVAEAQRVPLPAMLRLYADFERPGVCHIARQLGVRHVCMGYGMRAWGEFRHEVAQAVAERDHGHFDTVVVWTVNDEVRLQELVTLGVNGIITDTPALLHRIVREYRHREAGLVSQRPIPVPGLVGQVAHPWVAGEASR